MTTTENVTELMSHMSDAEIASSIEKAKADLQAMIDTDDRTRVQFEAIFAGGVLLVSELRRRVSA